MMHAFDYYQRMTRTRTPLSNVVLADPTFTATAARRAFRQLNIPFAVIVSLVSRKYESPLASRTKRAAYLFYYLPHSKYSLKAGAPNTGLRFFWVSARLKHCHRFCNRNAKSLPLGTRRNTEYCDRLFRTIVIAHFGIVITDFGHCDRFSLAQVEQALPGFKNHP
jgi:hypothetical protein